MENKIDTTGMTLSDVLTHLGWRYEKVRHRGRPGNRIIDADGLDYGVMHACDVWNMLRDQGFID